jgi:hypothetical protein
VTRSAAFALVCAVGLAAARPAEAQEHQHPAPPPQGWAVALQGQAFLTANFQVRKFRDFHHVEPQNWFMAEAARAAAGGTVRLHGMLSLEPFTLRRLGSAQAFQTGETLDDAPLVDYQHPHDLFMALEARYERALGSRGRIWASVAPVGPAAIGPTSFMHRPSAAAAPTAPLAHHQLDSSHITRSVLSAGAARGPWSLEGSIFKGREPDENRYDLDLGVPDSWSARLGWSSGGWRAQFSGGRFVAPEAVEPFLDITRFIASVEYSGMVGGRPLAATVAFGRNREFYGDVDGALAEAAWRPASRHVVYGRAEVVDKNILTAGGLHPPGFTHPHEFSTIGAFTAGYSRELGANAAGRFAIGGDVTVYAVPTNLRDSYGRGPLSFHLYLRWNGQSR